MDYKKLAETLNIDIDDRFIKMRQQKYIQEYGINIALQLAYRDTIIDEFKVLQTRVNLMWADWCVQHEFLPE